jgi:hypothetical protein
MNPVQNYMLNTLGVGTSEAIQLEALRVQPIDFSNVPAPQVINGVIQTDLPHLPNNSPTGSYFIPKE